jgi:hypothetical protein
MDAKEELATVSGMPLKIADPVEFFSTAKFRIIPEQKPSTVAKLATKVSVLNVTRFFCINTVATTITSIVGGQEGQEVKFLGDGFTTFQHGTIIFTNTAANKLLAANKVYTFTQFNSKWYENG